MLITEYILVLPNLYSDLIDKNHKNRMTFFFEFLFLNIGEQIIQVSSGSLTRSAKSFQDSKMLSLFVGH